jgi:hypothetical protein
MRTHSGGLRSRRASQASFNTGIDDRQLIGPAYAMSTDEADLAPRRRHRKRHATGDAYSKPGREQWNETFVGHFMNSQEHLMRYVVGFTKNVTEPPFHVVKTTDQPLHLNAGQFVKIDAATDWFQIYQIGTRIFEDRIFTTIVVGEPRPTGTLTNDENWSNAADWAPSF